jgi:ribosomal protein S18 acetylase RimI-like enzyme
MNTAHVQIRRLEPIDADAALFQDIRLEALRDAPEAFGSTLERELSQPLSWFKGRLTTSKMFGAFDGPEIVGMAGLLLPEGQKEAHKGRLISMYVRPRARKIGVGQQLVEAVIGEARQWVEIVQLAVVHGNEDARRLYVRLGFREYGLEKKSLKQAGRYYDEVLMAKEL